MGVRVIDDKEDASPVFKSAFGSWPDAKHLPIPERIMKRDDGISEGRTRAYLSLSLLATLATLELERE